MGQHVPATAEIRVDVVLPAGGRISGAFAATVGTDIKALIPIQGKTLLAHTIETLRATGRSGSILVIGPEEARKEAMAHGADGVLEEGATGPDNILSGLKSLLTSRRPGTSAGNPPARVLITTTDLPFLTSDALAKFLDACPWEADVVLPVVSRKDFEARFPRSHAVYVPLADGPVTMGCAFLVHPETILRNETHLRRVFAARKSQWQTARLVGARMAWRFLTRSLTIPEIVVRAGAILQCRGAAVLNAPPELAYDIDLPEEYEYALTHSAEFASSPPTVQEALR